MKIINKNKVNNIVKIIIVMIIITIFSIQFNNIYATTTSNQKSNNANLSNLGIKPYDFYGFEEDITTYTVAVPESTKSVEVYAEAEDKNAEITGTGDLELESGRNVSEVIVTAEDGTTKTYTTNIIKDDDEYNYQKKVGNSGVYENTNKGLESLEITGLTLDKEFNTNTYEYIVECGEEITELTIEAVPTDISYDVEIVGNTNLKEGENSITILVNDDDENIATYQIIAKKPLQQMSIFNTEGTIFENININYIYAFWILIGLIILMIIIRKIRKRAKKNNRSSKSKETLEKMKEYNEEQYFDDDYEEDDEYYEEEIELPRGLRKKEKQREINKKESGKENKSSKGKRYK